MSGLLASQKLSKEEYRRQKALDDARKAGTAPAEVDEEGKEINPHTPQFMLKAPWYIDTGKPGLKHQQAPGKKVGRKFEDGGWYARGQRAVSMSLHWALGFDAECD
jgi:pre-mRNA-processing factor SLU7